MSARPDAVEPRPIRAFVAGVLVLAALAAFVATRFELTTDISHFLPGGERDSDVELARELAVGELSRTLVVLVDGPDAESAIRAGAALEAEILADKPLAERLAFVEASAPEGIEEALWELYLPRRYAFVADTAAEARAAAEAPEIEAAIARLKDRLSSPMSTLVTQIAPRDPTLVLQSLFERLAGGRGEGLAVVDGRFLTEDGRAAVLFIGTRAAATDAHAQKPVLDGIRAAFERARGQLDFNAELSMSGAHRFAVRTEQAVSGDVRRVSLGSAIGLSILLLALFRSGRLVLYVLPVTAAAFLAGAAACLALFGSIHGLTLAFGAAMVGVSIDFAIHFHCHDTLAPDEAGPSASLRAIWPALTLSAATTAVGFFVLSVSSFPGLRELAVFGGTGIVAALLATRAFLPWLARIGTRGRGGPSATPLAHAVVDAFETCLRRGGRALQMAPALVVVALAALGLPRVTWNDDIADLSRLDPDLVEEDERVRARVVRFEQRRLVVATGETEEAALRANDGLTRVLAAATRDGVVAGVRGIGTLLPSAAQQRAVDAAFRGSPGLADRVEAALRDAGFRPDGFAEFRRDVTEEPLEPLSYSDLADSALAPLVRPFRVTLADSVGFVTFLHGLKDPAELARRLDAVDGARLVNVESVLSSAYGRYRRRMAALLGGGLLLVFGLVLARHRALRPTLAAYLPAVLAGLGTVSILTLLGLSLNMLSLVALLMVVGLGVDYGVLLAETRGDERSLRATYFAILVAASSTLLGFGMLAASEQPALFNLGITAAIGVLLSLLLAPTLGSFLAPSTERSRSSDHA